MPERTIAVGGEQLTSLSASTALASIPSNAGWAIIKSKSAAINLRLNGGTATATDMSIPADTPVEITSTLADVRIIGAGATVDVWYFG
jgi:hypothetical protein